MKILLSTLGFILIFFLFTQTVLAQQSVELYYFYDTDCVYCNSMADIVSVLDSRYPELNVISFDVQANEENDTIYRDLMDLYQQYDLALPTVIVGPRVFTGYSTAQISEIESQILYCRLNECPQPSQLLKEYWQALSQQEQSHWAGTSTFWLVILILWPLLGVGAIIYVVKKYR